MIDYMDLETDLKSVGVDDQTRLAFYVLAKHVNAAIASEFMKFEIKLDEQRAREKGYY